MRILLIHPREEAYDSKSVRDFPSGGTEKAFIFLGEAFQKLGHHVEWVTSIEDIEEEYLREFACDVVITQQAELLQHFESQRKIWWSHHFADQPITIQAAPWARGFADQVVTLSQCHHDDLKKTLKIDSTVIGHGVWLNELKTGVTKDPFRLVYASAPFRGLERIPELFKRIREQEPWATIAICSSQAMYGRPAEDEQYQKLFEELAGIEGVELKGALNQEKLFEEYARASIFFYPCIWPETYCIALDEAIAHRCFPVTTGLAALGERSNKLNFDGGFAGIGPAFEALQDPEASRLLWECVPNTGVKDWLEVAEQWEQEVLK